MDTKNQKILEELIGQTTLSGKMIDGSCCYIFFYKGIVCRAYDFYENHMRIRCVDGCFKPYLWWWKPLLNHIDAVAGKMGKKETSCMQINGRLEIDFS